VWSIIIVGNILFRYVTYNFDKKKKNEQEIEESYDIRKLPSLKEVGVAPGGIFVYNGLAYWIENNKIYRATHQDVVHVNTKEAVDPLNQKDLDIEEYMNILSKLESVQK
jgi:hypothetical protein